MSREKSESQLARELEEARSQLEEYKETLRAIRSGEVDALLVSTDVGDRVFKLEDKTYRLLFETLNEGTLTLSSDGSILYSNKAFADLVGAPLENVIGKPIFEFTSDKDVVGGYLDRTLLGTNLKDVEIELLNAGVQVTCEASTALLKDEDDIQQAVIVTIRDVSDRKRLENELRDRDASEYAQNIVSTVREPLVVLDDKFRVISANRSFYSTFKVTLEMTENTMLFDLGNHQWDIPKLRELLEKVLPKSTSIEDFEVEHDFPAIGRKTMLLNARRIRSKTGATQILLAIEDITERKAYENKLEEARENWTRTFDATSEAMFLIDEDLRVLQHNTAFAQLVGRDGEDLTRKKCYELVHNLSEAPDFCLTCAAIEEKKTVSAELFEPYLDKYLDAAVDPTFDAEGNFEFVLHTIRDITERKSAEEALKAAERKYRELAESLPQVVFELDTDGKITYVNRNALEEFGYSHEELESEIHALDVISEVDRERVDGAIYKMYSGQSTGAVREYIAKRKDGTEFPCIVYSTLITDTVGNSSGIRGILTDITERKRLEDELRDASEYAQDIVGTVREPLVVLDDEFRVISANRSFYSTFKVTPEMSENTMLFDLGNGQWNIPRLRELLEEVLPEKTSIEDFEVEHDFPAIGRKTMLLNARRIRSKAGATQILLAIEDITERLRLQRELRESELWYRILVETIPQKVFAKDRDLRIVFANRNFTADFELQDELLGKTDYDLFPRELADGYTADDRQVLESGETMDIEEAYMQDGEESRVHTVKTPLRDGDGNITGLLGIFWDVTEEKEAQRQLRTTQFESDKAGDMIIRYGPDGRIVYANEAACRRHGYSKEKFLALSVWDVTVDVTEKSFKETWSALMEKGEDRKETEHVCSNGSTFPAEVTLSLLEFEGEAFAFMFVRDTTELERLAEELKKIEWMLQPAGKRSDYIPPYGDVCSLTEGGLLLNKIGRDVLEDIAGEYLDLLETSAVIYEKDGSYAMGIFSSGWCRMLDNASFSLCGTDDLAEALKSGKWLCHESCWTDCSKVSVEEDRPVDIECNGGIHLYAVPIHAFGEVVGSANIGYGAPPKELKEIAERYGLDTDELKEAALKYRTYPQFMIDLAKRRLELSADFMGVSLERKLAEEASIENAERARCLNAELEVHVEALESLYEELDSFSYSISHDLRAPLRAIEGFSAMLMEDHRESLDNEGQRLLGVVSEQTQKMGDLIDALLRFSRTSREDLTLGPVDMRALCGEVVAEFQSRTGDRDVTFNVEELPPAIGDYRMLKQVFENLIGNAVKFTGTREKAVIDVGFQPEKGGTAYFVGDNGVGFNMEYAGNIFGVFQRYHSEKEFEGTGIGLSLVQRIVAKHGGKVRAEAEEDKGATFYFSLPQREEG